MLKLSSRWQRHPDLPRRVSQWQLWLLFALGVGLGFDGVSPQQVQAQLPQSAIAAAPATAPAPLTEMLRQMDLAANQQDLAGVLRFYSKQFKNTDGLSYQTLEQSLKTFWQAYPTLSYQTELLSWQPNGTGGWSAETQTTITGVQRTGGRDLALRSSIRSRQQLQNQQITQQEILSEQTQVTSGKKPPAVELSLPDQVGAGQQYNFDAIVKEPLGNSLLLGAALEEPINARGYLQKTPVKLELLPAGGLFKVGQAPNQPTSQWISAILIREDGMIMLSQRLNVVNRVSRRDLP